MQWLKAVGLFCASFGVSFCAVCFANAEEAGVPAPASSAILDQASDTALATSAILFAKTEAFRLSMVAYFDTKLVEAQAARAAKQAALAEDEVDIDTMLVAESKPLTEQVKDSSGIFESIKIQTYSVLSWIFSTVYAFYAILILFVLWILRKIFRRYRGY